MKSYPVRSAPVNRNEILDLDSDATRGGKEETLWDNAPETRARPEP